APQPGRSRAMSALARKRTRLRGTIGHKTGCFKAMYVQPPIRHSDERSPSPDSRRHIGQCLRHAFAVGDAGSFTSLLDAIGDDTGNPAAEITSPCTGRSASSAAPGSAMGRTRKNRPQTFSGGGADIESAAARRT
ncbi:MAG: hypothetical protein M3428_00420, partial [Pseudomonadota bacterium]|nr:hypothetical protein [Pseudomonadota bacterium]